MLSIFQYLFVGYIIQAKKKANGSTSTTMRLLNDTKLLKNTQSRFYFTESGWIDSATWILFMKDFANWWRSQYPGLKTLLVMDNLSSHNQQSIISSLDRQMFRHLFLHENTTHLFQPLDKYPFALLKRFLEEEHRKLMFNSGLRGQSMSQWLLVASVHAQDRAFTRQSIVKSFRVCGLFPLDVSMMKRILFKELPAEETPVDNNFDSIVQMVEDVAKKAIEKLGEPPDTLLDTLEVDTGRAYTHDDIMEKFAENERVQKEKDQEKARKAAEKEAAAKEREKKRKEAIVIENLQQRLKATHESSVEAVIRTRKYKNRCKICTGTAGDDKEWYSCTICNKWNVHKVCVLSTKVSGLEKELKVKAVSLANKHEAWCKEL